MADVKLRLKENAPGKFFVDSTCIACEACVLEAPGHFSMLASRPISVNPTANPAIVEADAKDVQQSIGKAYVHQQPQTQDELELVRSTLSICPTDSIGEMES